MADNITKEDLKNLLNEVRHEDMGHNNYYNVPPGGQVSRAIDNPLVWIGGYTILLGFLGVLIYAIYTNDKDTQNGKIDGNTALIKEVQEGQKEAQEAQGKANQVIIKMQGNQERIAKQIERNGESLEDIARETGNVKVTRFTDKDGSELEDEMQDFARAIRVELLREITAVQNDLSDHDNKLDGLKIEQGAIKANITRGTDGLKDTKSFLGDINDRLKTLEIENRGVLR